MEACFTSLVLVTAAETGDKTQLLGVVLARGCAGTTLGLMAVNVPAVCIGEKLARKILTGNMHILAATLFIIVGILTIWIPFTTAS